MAERVVVVHGLWMNALAMLPMARRLERCGFEVDRFGYRSMRLGLRENAQRLADFCKGAGRRVHLVGHSLGGLVVLSMLHAHPEVRVGRVVLAGSPYTDIASAHDFSRYPWGTSPLGLSVHDWLRQPRPGVPAGVELGVIAGTVPFGLARLFVKLAGPSDGVVRVEETHVPGATDSTTIETSHGAMLVSAEVARAICAFLKHGRFG